MMVKRSPSGYRRTGCLFRSLSSFHGEGAALRKCAKIILRVAKAAITDADVCGAATLSTPAL